MDTFDQHNNCAWCHNKGLGIDLCVFKTDCQFYNLLTSDQKSQLATPTYKARKDKKAVSPSPFLADPGSVFHIPVNSQSWKYLCFHIQCQFYQFKSLPFGLSTAPMKLTMLVKDVKLMTQNKGKKSTST